MSKNKIQHPKGYWIGIGISIGVAMGPLFGNIGIVTRSSVS